MACKYVYKIGRSFLSAAICSRLGDETVSAELAARVRACRNDSNGHLNFKWLDSYPEKIKSSD